MRPDPHELPELVRDLHGQGTAWAPAGLASRLHWGAPLRQPCAVLSCARLNRILEHNPGDFTLTVEAGMPLEELQQALAPHRQWLAVDCPWGSGALGGGSVGGLVARGLAGGYRQRYLGVRDQVIGIRVMRADGVAARAGGRVVKNVAGYDLMRLFTGSWGSLGLITEITLRTLPRPPHRSALLAQGSLRDLAPLARWLLGSSLTPERVDLWSAGLASEAGQGPEPLLLIALASVAEQSLQEQADAIAERTPLPLRPLAAAELESLLAAARGPSDADAMAAPGWLLRVGVKPDRLADLLRAPELADLPVDLAAGSGLGHAWAPAAALGASRVEALRRRCRELGGWLMVLRQPEGMGLSAWCDVPSRPWIEAVKRQFDPLAQLAPGRLPGVAAPCIPDAALPELRAQTGATP